MEEREEKEEHESKENDNTTESRDVVTVQNAQQQITEENNKLNNNAKQESKYLETIVADLKDLDRLKEQCHRQDKLQIKRTNCNDICTTGCKALDKVYTYKREDSCRYVYRTLLLYLILVYRYNDTTWCQTFCLKSSLDLGVLNLRYSVVKSPLHNIVLMTKQIVMSDYGDLFKGIGKLPGKYRVVETLLQNEQLRVRIQPNEELMKCITVQEHDTIPIWTLGHNRVHKCERCNCMMRCNCICHSENQWCNYDKRRDKESKMHSNIRRNKESSYLLNIQENKQVLGASGGDPDESPSDDPSSDEDDNYGHNKGNYVKKKKDKRKTWMIDADAWLKCIKEGGDFEHQAESLLSESKLPEKFALDAIRLKYAHFSSIISKICDKICVYIKEKSETIAHVWAATIYSKDSLPKDNDIVFVVLTTDITVKINEENFVIYQRHFLQVDDTDLNKEIEIMEYNNLPTSEEIDKLEKCLKQNAKSLMNNHSNLTRVTASWFRTDRNDTEHLSLRKELCIALFVHIKGYIPVGEKYFPTEIGGFPVVVREGIFTLCKGPNEYHENVKMGCAIGAEMVGTLGAFIEFENDNDLYGLTCAHVVFGHDKLKAILQKGICVFDDGIVVCQPANTNYKPLGKTVAAVYKSGGNGISGMEFALIRIHQSRWPTEGTFPDDSDYLSAGFGPDTPFEFASGNTLNTRRLPFPLVYKYGCESKLTQGVCRVNGSSVRTLKFQDNILDTELVFA
ncbi:uncharacterized protein LOC132759686 [Ruditapes philippinarum]|uniref:uncharacterized protein LOC132759686 n=1 Tax=Ruditapes philippinarum TaxID=129788 RepID=UPI00295BBBDF|nr:uncharacterized protein LOC132759686 [Ruditapes philippinarum]